MESESATEDKGPFSNENDCAATDLCEGVNAFQGSSASPKKGKSSFVPQKTEPVAVYVIIAEEEAQFQHRSKFSVSDSIDGTEVLEGCSALPEKEKSSFVPQMREPDEGDIVTAKGEVHCSHGSDFPVSDSCEGMEVFQGSSAPEKIKSSKVQQDEDSVDVLSAEEEIQCSHGSDFPVSDSCEGTEVFQGTSTPPEKGNSISAQQECDQDSADTVHDSTKLPRIIMGESSLDRLQSPINISQDIVSNKKPADDMDSSKREPTMKIMTSPQLSLVEKFIPNQAHKAGLPLEKSSKMMCSICNCCFRFETNYLLHCREKHTYPDKSDTNSDSQSAVCSMGLQGMNLQDQILKMIKSELGIPEDDIPPADHFQRNKNKCFIKLSKALCHLCDTDFPTKEAYLKHVYTVHGISVRVSNKGTSVKHRKPPVKRKKKEVHTSRQNRNMKVSFPPAKSPTDSKKAMKELKLFGSNASESIKGKSVGSATEESVFCMCPICASTFPSLDACKDHMKCVHDFTAHASMGHEWSSASQPLVVSQEGVKQLQNVRKVHKTDKKLRQTSNTERHLQCAKITGRKASKRHKAKKKRKKKDKLCNKYVCDICGKLFAANEQRIFFSHLRSHNADDLHKCRICDKAWFSTPSRLAHHMLQEHKGYDAKLKPPQKQNGEKCVQLDVPYTCSECGSGYTILQNFQEHLRTHSNKPFVCDSCHELFEKLAELAQHKWVFHKKIICSKCGEMFKFRFELFEHQQQPCPPRKAPETAKKKSPKTAKSEPFLGSSEAGNGATFLLGKRKNVITQEMEVKGKREDKKKRRKKGGVKEKLHECSTCKAKFCWETLLQRHMTRVREAPHSCKICCRIFTGADALSRHKDYHKKMVHRCDKCSKMLSRPRLLRLHKVWKHGEVFRTDKNPTCEQCRVTFSSDIMLANHRCKIGRGNIQKEKILPPISPPTVVTPDVADTSIVEFFRCNLCGKDFQEKSSLDSHECMARQNAAGSSTPRRKIELPKNISVEVSQKKPMNCELSKERLEALLAQYGKGRCGKEFAQCEDCKEWFASDSQLARHKCRCKKTLEMNSSVASTALETKESNVSTLDGKHTCKSTPVGQNHSPMKTGRKKNQQELHIQCERCNYKFTNVAQLAQHKCIYVVQDQDVHTCSKSNDIFSSNLELVIHDTQMHNASFFNL